MATPARVIQRNQILANVIQTAAINKNGITTHEIIPGVTGKTIKIYRIFLWTAGANTITLKTASTPLAGAIAFGANGEISDHDVIPILCCNAGESFQIECSAAVQISGWVQYTLSDQ